jgi:xyloglucan-specific exo-beta-1,4-glucanase
MGIAWVTFDHVSADSKTSSGSKRIFAGVANMGATNVFVSEDAGTTWKAVAGQNSTFIPHHGVLSPMEGPALYLPYANGMCVDSCSHSNHSAHGFVSVVPTMELPVM